MNDPSKTQARQTGGCPAFARYVILVGWLLGGVGAVGADEVSLIRVGDTWRFRRGTNEASMPVALWRELGFDDSLWSAGPSGFSKSSDEATALGPGAFRSVFFRKTFNLTDPGFVRWLVLRLDYTGGFVAYLNGSEIARNGLAGEPVRYDAYPTSSHTRGATVDIDISAHVPLLVPGENVLAIQLHASGTLVLVPELLANFQRGPMVANVSTNSVQIVWRTPVPSDSTVEFGPDAGLAWVLSDPTPAIEHALTLSGLEPDTLYYYRVRSAVAGLAAESPTFSFRTFKMGGSLSFAMLGDSGGGYAAQFRVAQVLSNTGVDLVLHTGDLIYGYFTLGYADTRLLSVYGSHARSIPYFFTFGNHELYGGSDAPYLDTLYLPTNSATGTEHYYSFDHGDAHFVSLYVPTLTPFAGMEDYGLALGSTQYNWLTNDLAQSSKPWKFVFMHSPIVTSSAHRYDDYNGNGTYDRLELQHLLLPILQQYSVQAAFSGHDHNYERFAPTNGVHQIVTGGGGFTLYSITSRDTLSAQFWSQYNCVKATIHCDTLRLEALDQFGNVFDTALIQRAAPPARTWRSTWHVATVWSGPPTDGDGNVTGQTLDLVGPSIPARAGDVSNLGEVVVNNDPAYLHLGFKQAMITAGQNILLFIESPRLAGVTTLAGLGNGLVDADEEGVDGLDCLENLSFVNFAPAVACLLGDEYADETSRSFGRPGLALDVGQGVFRLDATFTEVAGTRVQQFDLSPQRVVPGHQGTAAEQNADMIHVAIPYAALGGLQPGDQIKIGALVGGGEFDADAQTRQLDSGFLGLSLAGSGQGPVVLEGLTVQLADYPPNADSDADGLLDRWEVAHHLNPLSAEAADGAAGDPDGDGATNLHEQSANTDPRDAASILRVSLVSLGPNLFRVTWLTVPYQSYMLEYASDPAGPFLDVPDPFFPRYAVSTSDSYDLDTSPMSARPLVLFFRVRLVQ